MRNIYKTKTFAKIIITATIAVVFLFLLSPTTQAGSVPRIYTMGASSIGTDSVVLNGQILSKESGSYTRFEWGLSRDSLINKTSERYVGSGSSFVKFFALTSSLSSNTRYYFRAVARNNFGVSYGPISTFYTKKVIEKNSESKIGCFLLVDTGLAGGVGVNSVVLKGKVNPKGSNTYSWFSYGKSASLGSKTRTEYIGNNYKNFNIEKQLNNLEPNTIYYYKIIAENDCGVRSGSIMQFTTQEKNEIFANGANNANDTQNTETIKLVLSSSSGNSGNQIIEMTNDAVQLNNVLVLKEIVNKTFPNGTKGINSSFSGDVIEYTLLIKNIGVVPVFDVVVKDELSGLFNLVESVPDISYLSSGNSLIWNIDLIKPSETKKILLKVKAKPVDESIIVFNNFVVEVDEYIVVSKKVATVLNPASVVPKANINKDDIQKGIVASVFNSVKNGLLCTEFTGLIFSMFLFVVIFFAFSFVFLLYKTQGA